MSAPAARGKPATTARPSRDESFSDIKSGIDDRVLSLFATGGLRRLVTDPARTKFEPLWAETALAVAKLLRSPRKGKTSDVMGVHRSLVKGLPGEVLYISSAMAFDSLQEALPLFDVSAKTARARIGKRLSSHESEIALRIGRVLTMAARVFDSPDMARNYLRAPNFALGGAAPRDLLKTAEGEQMVLSELQAQADSGPV